MFGGIFSPRNAWGISIQFDLFLIFFQMGGEKPPTSHGFWGLGWKFSTLSIGGRLKLRICFRCFFSDFIVEIRSLKGLSFTS